MWTGVEIVRWWRARECAEYDAHKSKTANAGRS